MNPIRALVWCGAALSMPAALTAQSGTATEIVGDAVGELAARLAADVAVDGVGSLACAVVMGDSVVWQGAFGVANRATGAPASPETLYRFGSISKSITGLLLLALVERGVVGLDDAVETHLPEVRRLANLSPDHRPITYRDLATHAAGLAREPATSRASRGPFREWKFRLVAAIPATEVVAAPGEVHRYSNIGYGLLGFALERAAGRPYELLVHELVLEPLGMHDTFLVVPSAERGRLAAGYVNLSPDSMDPRVPRAEHRGRGYRVPGEGLYSTVGDMTRLVMAMTGALGEVPIGEASRRLALADAGSGYGIGFQIHRIGDVAVFGHSGTVAGYTAYLAFDTDTGAGVVVVRNYNHGSTNLGAVSVRTLLDLRERASVDPAAAGLDFTRPAADPAPAGDENRGET